MQNIAAIDVGSNAIRMMVARVTADATLETLESTRIPVRLGQDTFTVGQIGEPTMQAALDAFIRFRKVADQFEVGQLRAVGTSAMREARNSDILIDRIAQQAAIQLEIISGEEEARLIHLGVSKAVDLRGKRAVLIDIGGGSVEVTLSNDEEIISAESYAMGTVRLLRKLDANGNGTERPFSHLLREYTAAARRRIDREIGNERVDICVGTGGNIEEMGVLRKKIFKRESDKLISLAELETLIEKLSALSVEERMKKYNLRPDRADVILPAATVLHMIAREAGIKEIQVPGVGLKDGVLWDMLPLALGPRLPRTVQVKNAAVRLGQKYHFDGEHAAHVARIASRLFYQSLSLHHLDESDCLLLEVAALLHDIGHFINTIDHDQHGEYIVRHSPLIGMDARQQNIIATIVRLHRKTDPATLQEESFRSLPQKDRLLITKLCALLRMADSLEVSHTTRVQDVALERERDNQWRLTLLGGSDMMLEKWTLEKRKRLFEEVFGVSLEIH